MRAIRTQAIRSILASLIGLCGIVCLGPNRGLAADEPKPPIAIQFSLDRPIDAGAAPFIVASARGLFSAEGPAVATNSANGSPEAIARVAAGASDFALVDINELIRFRGKAGAPPIKAVFVLFNKSAYAIVARKSRGIHALSDIEGKTLGVAAASRSGYGPLWRSRTDQGRKRQAEQDQRGGARADIVGGSGRCGRRASYCRRSMREIAACRPSSLRCFNTPITAARPTGSR
jgi:hypothetical protein